MILIRPFAPSGNTLLLSAGVASSSVQIPLDPTAVTTQIIVTNNGSTAAFIAFGNSSVAAAIPTAGSPANGIPIEPNTAQAFSIAAGAYVAGITASGTTSLYITPGFGC